MTDAQDSGLIQGRPIPHFVVAAPEIHPNSDWYWNAAGEIIDEAASVVGAPRLALLDALSRRWLIRARSPWLHELEQLAERLGRRGVYFLNLSFEWACTVALRGEPDGAARMLRVLDWGPETLGPTLCAIDRRPSNAAHYLSLTWPMFIGEATIVAPGRFAIALNRAPTRWGVWTAGRWERLTRLLDSIDFNARKSLPPAHLLRRVAEEAATVADAIEMLMRIPTCKPAIFCVAGYSIAESGVVEKQMWRARFRSAPATAANHWHAMDDSTTAYPQSVGRAHALAQSPDCDAIENWCVPPILNQFTRFAADICLRDSHVKVATAAGARLCGPATSIPLRS